jgi:hypothetical protein
MWEMCEPTAQSPFDNLDRHLLRITLEVAYRALTGDSAQDNPVDFAARMAAVLTNVGITGALATAWQTFLTRDSEPDDPLIIQEARTQSPLSDTRHHLQVISRAAMLLRITTGACASMIASSGYQGADVKFWWSSLGQDRGFWEPGGEPADFSDLWADIDVALNDFQTWEGGHTPADASYLNFHDQGSHAISVLAGCERIALWGFGL